MTNAPNQYELMLSQYLALSGVTGHDIRLDFDDDKTTVVRRAVCSCGAEWSPEDADSHGDTLPEWALEHPPKPRDRIPWCFPDEPPRR